MRKIKPNNIRKIQQSKGSYNVNLPIHIIRELGWRERQKVIVLKRGKGILIKDWSKQE